MVSKLNDCQCFFCTLPLDSLAGLLRTEKGHFLCVFPCLLSLRSKATPRDGHRETRDGKSTVALTGWAIRKYMDWWPWLGHTFIRLQQQWILEELEIGSQGWDSTERRSRALVLLAFQRDTGRRGKQWSPLDFPSSWLEAVGNLFWIPQNW